MRYHKGVIVKENIAVDSQGNRFELRERYCPLCGTAPQRFIGYRGGDAHRYGLGISTRIVQCRRCEILFPNPFPYPCNPHKMYGDPDKYFDAHNEAKKIIRYRSLIREIVPSTMKGAPSILDVGSGRGELLQAARQEGLRDVVGLEFNQAMIHHVRERYNISVVPKTIEEFAQTSHRVFDIVFLNAVLEHVYDPNSMMEACSRLTTTGSILFMDVPNEPNLVTFVGNSCNRILGKRACFNLSPTWPPYHVFGFSPRVIRILCGKHGFEVIRIQIRGNPKIPSKANFSDRLQAFVAMEIGRLANATGTASNMYVWTRKQS